MTTMPLVATSLKLPAELKKRLARLAEESGESPHALMVRALERHADQAERYSRFLHDAEEADAEMRRTGLGYALEDVREYFTQKLKGKPARRPRPVRWRK